jgi:GNAT superfamily N-acetyltransferase
MIDSSLIETILFSRRDCPQILALFASRPEYFSAQAIPMIDRCLEPNSGYRICVIRKNERIIGCVIWHEGLFDAEINWLVVAADKEKQNFGRIMIEHVVDCVKRCGLRYLQLKTADIGLNHDPKDAAYTNTHAFYKKCGFSQVTTLPGYWPSGEDAALFMKRV